MINVSLTCYIPVQISTAALELATEWNKERQKCDNSREPVVSWSCPRRSLSPASAPTLAGRWSSPCLLVQCVIAFSPDWLISSTRPGRLYSNRPVSPPGLCDLRRASSLTNKRCVGMKEKPPRRCQNKSLHRAKTFRPKAKFTVYHLIGLFVNVF